MQRRSRWFLIFACGAWALGAGACAFAAETTNTKARPTAHPLGTQGSATAGKAAVRLPPTRKKKTAVASLPVPLPRPRPAPRPASLPPPVTASLGLPGASFAPSRLLQPPHPAGNSFALAATESTPAADLQTLKRLFEALRKGREAEAEAAERGIADPLARKLAEWAILRSDSGDPGFRRYLDFITANPSWPHVTLFRKRAEAALWNDRADDATVRAFFAARAPLTAKGRYALARALRDAGDRAGAAALVREAWRNEDCSDDVEARVLATFGDLLTRADHKARMDRRFYEEDTQAGLRAAERLGGAEVALARAWAAVIRHARNAKALLDAVPADAQREAGYAFARAQWLRRENRIEEAARLVLAAPRAEQAFGADAWWQERRILVRALLDRGDAHTAYRLAVEAVMPDKPFFRGDKFFTAGWIALRFLNDPRTAASLFGEIGKVNGTPHGLSRAGYWQGRAAEALGEAARARRFYEAAAAYTATYYGQLARARLGLTELGLRGPPPISPAERRTLARLEIVRAVKLLYALDERDLVAAIYAELGTSGSDVAGLAELAEVAFRHGDGRAMALLGEEAYARGLPLEYFAFPTVGLPDYRPIAPPIDPAVAYAVARQESHFNQKVVSPAHAMGLMQVTPEAAIDTARRFKATYDRARLLSDPVYNMQMGAAELANLFMGYNGSYILTFAGYNAGRGRVRQWIAAYGDPRDPSVDPIDWVERIPLSETRNYVMRVMENLQVYRARFTGGGRLLIEADLRRGSAD
ncbi:MAG: lytic transglycosylase domain-containing protein [Pseudolabrys sp.]|nr:lytic transglycosylase domain-containing protein [Pseudolabrys sp.]